MADLLDLMGQPGGRELILDSIRSSCHQPLSVPIEELGASRQAEQPAAGRGAGILRVSGLVDPNPAGFASESWGLRQG